MPNRVIEGVDQLINQRFLRQRLIFIEWAENSSEEGISERRFDFDNGKTISMENIKLLDYSALYSAILKNKGKR